MFSNLSTSIYLCDATSVAVSPSPVIAVGKSALSAVGLMPPCGVRARVYPDPAVLGFSVPVVTVIAAWTMLVGVLRGHHHAQRRGRKGRLEAARLFSSIDKSPKLQQESQRAAYGGAARPGLRRARGRTQFRGHTYAPDRRGVGRRSRRAAAAASPASAASRSRSIPPARYACDVRRRAPASAAAQPQRRRRMDGWVRVRVWPERHRAQSCAIALRSPAPERPSDLKTIFTRYSPDWFRMYVSGPRRTHPARWPPHSRHARAAAAVTVSRSSRCTSREHSRKAPNRGGGKKWTWGTCVGVQVRSLVAFREWRHRRVSPPGSASASAF